MLIVVLGVDILIIIQDHVNIIVVQKNRYAYQENHKLVKFKL